MPVIVLCLLTSNKNHLFCLLVSNKSIILAHVFIFSVQLHHGNNERNIPYSFLTPCEAFFPPSAFSVNFFIIYHLSFII